MASPAPADSVSPGHKREAVREVAESGTCSLGAACRYLGLHWSSFCYRAKTASDKMVRLVRAIIAVSRANPRYGYRRVRAQLANDGWQVSRKLVQKVRRAEGLGVKPPCQSLSPRRPRTTWSPNTSTPSTSSRARPGYRAKRHSQAQRSRTNPYMESFHNHLQDECLKQEWFLSLTEAHVVIENWRRKYNSQHPHSRLGFISPDAFARIWQQTKAVLGSVRPTGSLHQALPQPTTQPT